MKGPSSSFCCSSELGCLGSLPGGGYGCSLPADSSAFSLPDASSHPFLGQNSFRHRFLSYVWWVQRSRESFYKSGFAFQSLLNQHCSKPTGCHASQSRRWQICHVMSDLRENGKGETLPRTATVLERVVHWSGSQDFCIPSDFCQSKPHISVLWAATTIFLWSHLKNWTWSFLEDLAPSV